MGWQENFMQLYISTDLKDGVKAFELKRKHIPDKLYRYRSISEENIDYRKREISMGELFLSHPQKLNDPFECWSVLHSPSAEDYIDKWMYRDYFLEKGLRKEWEYILKNDNWFEVLARTTFTGDSFFVEKEEVERDLKNNIMNVVEKFNKEIREKVIDIIRIACFSTTATNLPMWNHYTDGHCGVCLEYSTDDIKNTFQRDSLFPVQYVAKLPDMAQKLAHRDGTSSSMPVYLSLHKLSDWAYENEWRMIYDPGYWIRRGESLPEGYGSGVAIDFIKPSKVILGIHIESEIEREIVECAQEQGIEVIKAQLTERGLYVG